MTSIVTVLITYIITSLYYKHLINHITKSFISQHAVTEDDKAQDPTARDNVPMNINPAYGTASTIKMNTNPAYGTDSTVKMNTNPAYATTTYSDQNEH